MGCVKLTLFRVAGMSTNASQCDSREGLSEYNDIRSGRVITTCLCKGISNEENNIKCMIDSPGHMKEGKGNNRTENCCVEAALVYLQDGCGESYIDQNGKNTRRNNNRLEQLCRGKYPSQSLAL